MAESTVCGRAGARPGALARAPAEQQHPDHGTTPGDQHRPANVGTETIAAELAGWAAGELPGQAWARLAAWAAIGGVPAPGHRQADGSDVGPAGVATERVR